MTDELTRIEQVLARRKKQPTGSLASQLVASPKAASSKFAEESAEFFAAVRGESDVRVASEAADVVFALLCCLASRGVPLSAVATELASRQSGYKQEGGSE